MRRHIVDKLQSWGDGLRQDVVDWAVYIASRNEVAELTMGMFRMYGLESGRLFVQMLTEKENELRNENMANYPTV